MSGDDIVVRGTTYRRNVFAEWCVVSDESGELHQAWQEADCLDEIERLRAERDAIDALHQPDAAPEHDPQCIACRHFWPCRTHVLLHPKEARRER